jgi:protein SCO1
MKFRVLLVSLSALLLQAALGLADAQKWMQPGPLVPSATLVDQDGKAVAFSELVAQRDLVLSFFFTGCSAVCPTDSLQLEKVRQLVAMRSGSAGDLARSPIFVSVALDPAGDTPQAMREYAARLSITSGTAQGWYMLGGDETQLEKVWRSFGQPLDGAAAHDSMFWVGQVEKNRWTRISALAEPRVVADLLGQTE